jgi:CheY-like chemotaxis protein
MDTRTPGRCLGAAMSAPLDGVIVLLVDGSEERCHQLSVALHEAGAIAITVGTAAGAVGLLEALRCDVVVMDLHLPDQEGSWLFDEIRKRRARLGTIPVIALTARTPWPRRDLRFARYLTQPVPPDALIEAIAGVHPKHTV